MLGVLLESRARVQRRTGGIALSVVTHVALTATLAQTPSVPVIELVAPVVTPPSLPPISPDRPPTPDDFVISHGGKGRGPISLTDAESSESNEWRTATEVLMHLLASGKPRYPETLRQAGVDGSVVVQFTVDTLGRVDLGSVKILRSTHDLFTEAVRQSLGAFRFKPAEVNGKRVPALAQLPFEFHLDR